MAQNSLFVPYKWTCTRFVLVSHLGLSLSRIRTIVNPQLEKPPRYPSYRYFVHQDVELLELWHPQREK